MDSSFWLLQQSLDSPLYTFRGVRLYIFLNIVFFCMMIFFNSTNSEDPHERNASLVHFIWVFTVYKSTRLGVSRKQRVMLTRSLYLHNFHKNAPRHVHCSHTTTAILVSSLIPVLE